MRPESSRRRSVHGLRVLLHIERWQSLHLFTGFSFSIPQVSSKIGVIESLLAKCDKIIIGGGMIFTFYKARGLAVGGSLVEEDKLELAKELEAKAKASGVELILPTDVVIADKFAPDANTKIVDINSIPDGWMVSALSGRWHV